MNKHKNKFHNQKTVFNGITFDSKREAERYKLLYILERAGKIKKLRRQVPFELVPKQTLPIPVLRKRSRSREMTLRPVVYIADFVYEKGGSTVVEDAKGMRTPEYTIKRKLMLWVHGIQVMEV